MPFDMPHNAVYLASGKCRDRCSLHGGAINAVYHHTCSGFIDSQCRVAQQRILKFVGGLVLSIGYHIVLSKALRLAKCHGLTPIFTEQKMQIGHVYTLIVVGIDSPRGAEESHRASVFVQYGCLANGGNSPVERHNVARCGYPKGQIGIGESLKIIEAQHRFVRNLVGTTMPHVVHNQCASSLLLLDDVCYFGIRVARCTGFALKHVPHHLLNKVLWMLYRYTVGHSVGIAHVQVLVSVVAHKHDGVLPCTCIGILGVCNGLVYHCACVVGMYNGETANSHILQVTSF